MHLIKKLYKSLVPENIRWKIWRYRSRNSELGLLRKEVLQYYESLPANKKTEEINEVLTFIKKYDVVTFPYPFIYDYDIQGVKVYHDERLNLPYVLLQEKRLYYKRSWTTSQIQENFNFLSIEQDPRSPHRYLTDTFQVNDGDVVADIGAAEGNFGLSVIEKVANLYIFETDAEWIEALEATFAPWKDKVQIINKYVSDSSGDATIKLDDFMAGNKPANFLKIDTEGAEAQVLSGASGMLEKTTHLKVAICTYHKQNDQIELSERLSSDSFAISYSNGYMFFLEDKQSPPYLRRGLIRATKQPLGSLN
ncbi:FkbM family methyltransferase [uncultured Pontibacter sp.]|uniref:FkbM family methyltransferase n=1 Tax=uncultured Pontibacter sp. TaxID=453356 RepID=UPI0026369F04|nr:FkbM family methyltransferase [uncultured Pontibacter sp.]